MTIYCNGKEINLVNKDYVAEGGEGVIYVKNNIIYKIYHNSSDVLPVAKFNELSELQNPNIINPIEFIYNKKNSRIGITMKFVQNTVPLARLFTTSFRNRNNVSHDMSIELIEKMAEIIQYIHSKDIIMVDGNEFNYLIDGTSFINPYFIDVDSYQTKSFPAKVIMPSIRDWAVAAFSPLSDWFSFAIIAVQILIGIHPFKGSHPKFDKSDIKGRMLSKISIFNKGVSLPPSTRDFGLIPKEYMAWFLDLFEKGKRMPPPTIITKFITKPQQIIISGGDKFIVDSIFNSAEKIIDCSWINGNRVIQTKSYFYFNNQQVDKPTASSSVVYISNTPYFVDIKNKILAITQCFTRQPLSVNIAAEYKIIIDNRLYVLNDDKFIEIKFKQISNQIIVAPGTVWNILPNATKIFRGLLYSDVLGKAFLYIPSREDYCEIIGIDELKGHKILDVQYEEGICILISHYNGVYCRSIIKFNNDFKYTIEIESDITLNGANFVMLPNGIFLIYTGDGELIISSKGKDVKNILTNVKIGTLCHYGQDVFYYQDEHLYKIKMKN